MSAAVATVVAPNPPKPTPKLTRAELIQRGDAICYRLNARRISTRIETSRDYEQLVPPLAVFEMQGANELNALTPPASLTGDWQRIVEGSREIAEVMGRFHHLSEAHTEKLAHPYSVIFHKAVKDVVNTARSLGFKECSRFL